MELLDQTCTAEDRRKDDGEEEEDIGTRNCFIFHSWDGAENVAPEPEQYDDRLDRSAYPPGDDDDPWTSLDHRPAYVRSTPPTMGPGKTLDKAWVRSGRDELDRFLRSESIKKRPRSFPYAFKPGIERPLLL